VQAGTLSKPRSHRASLLSGGVSNGTHVAWRVRYNGEDPCHQGIPVLMAGFRGTGAEYDGYMRRSGTVIKHMPSL
jgi:hypothetical protein